MTSLPETKEGLRSWARATRSTLDWEAISIGVIAGLADWKQLQLARTVLLFLPMSDEVILDDLQVVLPDPRYISTRTPNEGRLSVHELGGPLEYHRYGFLQPRASAPVVSLEEVDVFLLPGLAFDLHGIRLGRGRGYFDALLARCRREALLVGVVPTALVVDCLPKGSRDIAMGYLATEEGVVCVT